jgi:hypothetical protein
MNRVRSSEPPPQQPPIDLATATAIIAALLCDDPTPDAARATARAFLVAAGRKESARLDAAVRRTVRS